MNRAEQFDMTDRMHCFFHLVKGRVVLTDDTGVAAADAESAVAQILIALRDFLAENPDVQDDWHGWSLHIVDHSGDVLTTISLDGPEEEMQFPGRQWQHA